MDERRIVERILGSRGPVDRFRVPPGDDAAVFGLAGDDVVVSTDASVEGVHFDLSRISPAEAGGRAAAAALSDLAAMGARPLAVFLSVAGPDADTVAAAGAGARRRAGEFQVPVGGGDVARGPVLMIDVVVLGAVSPERRVGAPPWRRGGAHPGDGVWVTGRLGAPGAALEAWSAGRTPADDLRDRFVAPVPRLREAVVLADAEVIHAAIDLSDGLFRDAARVAAASGVRIDIVGAAIPIWPGVDGPVERVGGRGEEYELLLCAPAVSDATATALAGLGCPITRIGTVREGEGVRLDDRPVPTGGFDHFDPTPDGEGR